MSRVSVPLNGNVLRWAREEAALSVADLATLVKVDPGELSAWERGDGQPTKGQFTKLVGKLRRPSAIFFLPQPPRDAGLPTEFRRGPGLRGHELQQDELRLLRWTRRLQGLVEWAARDAGQATVAIPQADAGTSPIDAAAEFRRSVGISVEEQVSWKEASQALRSWRARLEELGVVAVQLSLGRESIRGFSVWSDVAPLIAVNTAYHPTARIFSLFHEAGHLVRRSNSACYDFVAPDAHDDAIERWCERFAAAFLLPADAVRQVAGSRVNAQGKVDDVYDARAIANRFKTSTRASTLRLQELGLAETSLYGKVVAAFAKYDWNTGGGGGGQPRTEKRLGQIGHRAAEVLLASAAQGRLHERDLADHLRLTTGEVADLRSMVSTV